MLQLLLERGQSYDDLAQVLGVAPEEVRARARAALTELAGADPDRDVALTDYLLGQADPIDRADAVRHLKGDPEDLAMATELAQKLRLVAPEAQLPRLPGSERRPRPRRAPREVPAPLRRVLPARRGGEPREPRTTLTRRQTQAIVVAGCAAVLIAVGALAAAGVFTDSSGSATSATATTSTTSASNLAGRPQGYPLGIVRPSASGSFQNTIPIPQAVQSILPQVQAVTITLAENRGVAKAIQTAIKQRQPLQVQGRPEFLGVVAARQGKVFPIQLRAGKGVKGSGDAALGIANKQPFFQIRLQGLQQPPKGQSYIIWLVLGTGQGG
jgi:hypothetical protein